MLGYLSLDIVFLVAHSFPRLMLSENCSLLGTGNVHGQISWHIFAPNEGYCLDIVKDHLEMQKLYNLFGTKYRVLILTIFLISVVLCTLNTTPFNTETSGITYIQYTIMRD